MDWEIIPVIIISVVAAAIVNAFTVKKENKISVMYGYPRYKRTWLTIYHYRDTDKWLFEWDDLFDDGRPKSWGSISDFLMYRDKNVTDEEYNKALRILKQDGLY